MGDKGIDNRIWMSIYKLLEEYYKEHGNIDVPRSYEIKSVRVGMWLDSQRQAYKGEGKSKITEEQIGLLEKLGMKWNVNVANWVEYYKLLEEYYKEHGNIDVPYLYEINGIKLGRWLITQRQAYKGKRSYKLTQEQIKLLEKLGIKWNVNVVNWQERYKLLEEYYKEHGNIDVPYLYEINGIKLGRWLITQRQAYKGKRSYKLTQEQIKLLEKLGMKWEDNTNLYKVNWQERYKLLEEYYKEHGNIDVPCSYEINGIKLGRWLITQRQAYKGKGSCKLTQEQIKLLEKLGIKWNVNVANWVEYYKLLEEYYKEHGNIDVPYLYEINGIKLGRWLANQRQAYKGKGSCKLTQEQIKLLEKLGIKWNVNVANWVEYYKLLEEYYKEHGNIDVPRSYEIKSVRVGMWLDSQRQAYKGKGSCKLTQEQIKLLEKLGIKWNVNVANWVEYYKLLEEYYIQYGNIDVPCSYEINGVKLGQWLITQRQAYRGIGQWKITNEHIKLLNDLDIDWAPKDTKLLNKEIVNIEEYNTILLNRLNLIFDDLVYEGVNEIEDDDKQKEITNVLIKRIWR